MVGHLKELISELNTQPGLSPVNASTAWLPIQTHHSGPRRLAKSYLVRNFHSLPSSGFHWRTQSPFFNRLLSQGDYLELLDWTARQVAPGKRGTTPPLTPPLFQRLSGKLPTATAWVELVQDFGKLFAVVAGHPQTIRATRSRISGFPHRMRPRIRELLPTSE